VATGSHADRDAKTSTATLETTVGVPRPALIGQSPWRRRGRHAGRLGLLLLLQLLILVAFFASWSISVRRGWLDPFFVSTPSEVWDFLRTFFSSGDAWPNIKTTLIEILGGFVIGSITGILAGLLLSRFLFAAAVARPFLIGLNSLPRVALAPMFILWFGIGMTSKIVLSVSLVFFIVMIGTEAAVRSVDRDMLTTARLVGASERQNYMKVVLPASVPAIFASLRLGIVYSLLGVVVAEMLAAQYGLGQLITLYSNSFVPAGTLAIITILLMISLILNGIMALIERRLMRWTNP